MTVKKRKVAKRTVKKAKKKTVKRRK